MDTKGNPSLINLFLVVRYTAPDNKNGLLTLCMLVFIVIQSSDFVILLF